VVEFLPADDATPQKRRSTRIVQAVPITVSGVDALGQPFKERTTTVMVNCHGCKYQSKHYVPKNSTIKLEIPRPEPSLPPRELEGRVVWVQRPRAVRELFQIGLEFEAAGNVWGIAFPPEDWFPCPGEEATAAPAPAATGESTEFSIDMGEISSASPAPDAIESVPASVPHAMHPAITPPPAPVSPEGKVHVMPAPANVAAQAQPPSPAATHEAQLATAKQMAKMVAEAKETLDKSLRRDAQSAINDEMTIVRQQLDVQLHEAVERAIKVSMERVSESAVKKVVQQAADRTNAIVEEARKASEVNVENLDAKVRQAVEQAVSQAADQAAQHAAEQATAFNLKNAVEEAVERVVSQREASNPSLSILSSPEAAQQQLDQWKRNLEETAQGVRAQTIEEAQADARAAKQRWNEEFEAALAGASQHIGDKISQASQAALAQAERDLVERQSGVHTSLDESVASAKASIAQTERDLADRQSDIRASFDETVANAQATLAQAEQNLAERQSGVRTSLDDAIASAQAVIESLGSGLQEERARADEAREQLQDAARSTIEQTRRNLEDVAAAQHQEAVRRADAAITERTKQIEPMLQVSAQQVLDRLSAELDHKLAPKIDEAHRAASGLTEAGEQASRLQSTIREQVQQASDQAAQIEAMVREHARKVAEQAAQVQSATREQVQRESQQAVQESLQQLRQETAKVPAEFEQNVRATLTKIEEEFEQKSVGAQHETYEALSKAADWYQKKAHTTMQSSLEKAVEQSTSALRGRAAEISSLVASELDHYRRSYVEHSQAEIEEAAKEIVDRERSKLGENAEMAHAGFVDRVQNVTGESLRRFEEASRQSLEKARSDMEFNREGALTAFQKSLEEKMLQTVEQAQVHFQSQIGPVIEALEGNRQRQHQEWMAQLRKSTDESIEQYKSRLENASNSWLLASATTLGQHSQAVLDTLAKAAEKRMRESVAGVLAGMGDTLKDRLMGISSNITAESDEDDDPPPVKK
jgi:PilZ domain